MQENIRITRIRKGFTQEEIAVRLNVTRQTISKWEKGYSVPDAEMLISLANVLEVPVSELLGGEVERMEDREQLAEQLARINEQLATKNRRSRQFFKIVGIAMLSIMAIYIVWIICGVIGFNNATKNPIPAHVNIDGVEQEIDPNNAPIEIIPENE